MGMQAVVSKATGNLTALYIWSEKCPWQGALEFDGNAWLVTIEHQESSNLDISPETQYAEVGAFPTLHAALDAYRAHDWAVQEITNAHDGDLAIF
jgi:hypothetical protein